MGQTIVEDLELSAAWLLVGIPLRILLTVIVAAVTQVLLVRFVHRLVDGAIRRADERRQAGGEDRHARTRQRASAIGQLAISVVSVLIWANAVLIVLTILGINVVPVIASAGVVGVALAFGAQALVKDYLSGILLIIEDQYGVGDDITVGEVSGIVEEVTLRVTRLHDADGVVWYVRNGEILAVANRSQGRREG
jgi:small conductance mechanosensitive channel